MRRSQDLKHQESDFLRPGRDLDELSLASQQGGKGGKEGQKATSKKVQMTSSRRSNSRLRIDRSTARESCQNKKGGFSAAASSSLTHKVANQKET